MPLFHSNRLSAAVSYQPCWCHWWATLNSLRSRETTPQESSKDIRSRSRIQPWLRCSTSSSLARGPNSPSATHLSRQRATDSEGTSREFAHDERVAHSKGKLYPKQTAGWHQFDRTRHRHWLNQNFHLFSLLLISILQVSGFQQYILWVFFYCDGNIHDFGTNFQWEKSTNLILLQVLAAQWIVLFE
jgi:hypothetical protein